MALVLSLFFPTSFGDIEPARGAAESDVYTLCPDRSRDIYALPGSVLPYAVDSKVPLGVLLLLCVVSPTLFSGDAPNGALVSSLAYFH